MSERRFLPSGVCIEQVALEASKIIPELAVLNAEGNIETYPGATGIPEAAIRDHYDDAFLERKQNEFLGLLASPDSAVIFVASLDGALIGYGMSEIDNEERHEISGLQVRRKNRGEGAGTALTQAGIIWLRKRGPADICLTVVQNTPAVRLYRRLLFEETGNYESFGLKGGQLLQSVEMKLPVGRQQRALAM